MIRWARVVGVGVVVVGVSCGGGNSEGSESSAADVDEVASAAFIECAESHGAGVRELVIGANGVEQLLYTAETPAELYDAVAATCEQVAMGAVAAAGGAEPPDLPPIPDGVATAEDYMAHLGSEGFSGAVLVGDGAEVVASGGLGQANRETGEPATADTAFDVGSVTKVFTAVAVLRAVEAGDLTLDTPLSAVFDDVPSEKAGITVEDLLAHRSGLGEYHDTDGDFEAMNKDEALERIFAQELMFDPGTDEAYSNSGYTLLAAILEEVHGAPFEQTLAALFDLVGMAETGVYGSDDLQDASVATGYGGLELESNSPASWPAVSWALMGSGGVASSVSDLHRWVVAAHDGTLLGDEMQTVLYEQILGSPPPILPNVELAGYAGANDFGFEVVVVELLGGGQHVIVASNVAGGDGPSATEAGLIMTQLLAESGTS